LAEFSCFCCDFGEPIGDAAEEAALASLGKRAAEHFQNVASDMQGISLSRWLARRHHFLSVGRKPTSAGLAGADPVATKLPNAYGLCDMLGSVFEWVDDFFDDNFYAKLQKESPIARDPHVLKGYLENHVLRGANSALSSLRAAARWGLRAHETYPNIGFRCVWEP
jgi:formylglycine-generating enzyme required for sulfatase activity